MHNNPNIPWRKEKHKKESWKILKSLRQEKKTDIISPIPLQNWDKNFSDLLQEDGDEFKEPIRNNTNISISTSSVRKSIKEVKDVCNGLKTRKSPGPNNIPAELIKFGTQKLYEHLAELFQT